MKNELKEEAFEQIYKEIRFGFDSKDQILIGIIEMFYDEENIDKAWIKNEIENQYDILVNTSVKK